jgi:hypothetical protein
MMCMIRISMDRIDVNDGVLVANDNVVDGLALGTLFVLVQMTQSQMTRRTHVIVTTRQNRPTRGHVGGITHDTVVFLCFIIHSIRHKHGNGRYNGTLIHSIPYPMIPTIIIGRIPLSSSSSSATSASSSPSTLLVGSRFRLLRRFLRHFAIVQ